MHSTRWAITLLTANGFAVRTPRHLEVNLLLDTADGRLRGEGKLLRVRDAQGRTIVTYKGVATTGKHKSREEIEISTGSLPATLALLARVGFEQRFRYEKYRTEYGRLGDPGVVTLDETPIGEFFEIEGPGAWIDAVARKLGFDEAQYVTESYGRLYLDWCRANGQPPSNMVFRNQAVTL